MWLDDTHPMLLPESSFKPEPRSFFGFFGFFSKYIEGYGHIDMLKMFPGDIDSKYV